MDNIDNFLKEWNGLSTATGDGKCRQYGNLIVELSKSGRTNVVRLNCLRSTVRGKGEASKFIKWLNGKADKGDFSVSLIAQPLSTYDGAGNVMRKDQLVNWLKRHGYRVRYTLPEGSEVARAPYGHDLPVTL